MPRAFRWLWIICLMPLASRAGALDGVPELRVSFPASVRSGTVTGRLLLIVSRQATPEPRLLLQPGAVQVFGKDVFDLRPEDIATFGPQDLGDPIESLPDVPPGDYFMQALLNVYTLTHRSDGHSVWVHLDRGEGQAMALSPGNLYSDVMPVHFGGTAKPVHLALSHVLAPVKPPPDSPWVKHISMESHILSEFWGVPMFIGATVLLPKDYELHPEVKYPAVYLQGWLGQTPFLFNEDPGSATRQQALRRVGLETGYDFYRQWNSENFPRFVAITFYEPSPYFPDAYGINSANNGPYGDAIVKELIPELERRFRLIPRGYARLLEGASTGGWESLALQVQYPDDFGGAWILYPDPVDFRHLLTVNIYSDANAFFGDESNWYRIERPMERTDDGETQITVRQESHFESVLGSKGRSGLQFNGWEAVFGPTDTEGYPRPLWDKRTGKIDAEVAKYMRAHGYDLLEYVRQNWTTLDPKLRGKLRFACGDMDNYFLNLALYQLEDFFQHASASPYPVEFRWGRPLKGHWWHPQSWTEMLREMAEQVKRSARPGADIHSWNY